jgi:O-antigen/teichoic acid export membrane protein
MAYPVVFVPMTVIGALCVVILPEIAKNLGNKKVIKRKFLQAFFISLLITCAFSLLLLLFAPWFSIEFFKQAMAGQFMVMLIPSVIFLGLSQVSRTALNGLGKQKTLMITSTVDGALGLFLTYIFVWRFGIYGFILANCIQDFLAFIMNFSICLYQIKNIRP